MSRSRHSGKPKRAFGGAMPDEPEIAGGPPPVLKSARNTKDVGTIEGERGKKRGDRFPVKRAAGGRVGLNPFSSAHGGGPKIEGTVEKAGSKPVDKSEPGHAVKAALKSGGRC